MPLISQLRTIQMPNFHSQTNGPMRSGLFFFLLSLLFSIHAQERCGTIAPATSAFENWMSTKISERENQAKSPFATLYQIPVVVHVFHKGEPVGVGVNLSEDRIKEQIDSLTADFRRMNADAANTPSEFLPVAADIEVEFLLAKQDPAGNPTNGIVRLQGSRDVYRANSHRPLMRSESYWPAEHYLNIFVVDLQTFIGYASFPIIDLEGITNNSDDYAFDGVLVDFEYFGVNLSTPTFDSYGRTLTHEVGHWLGLRHIWGDGNCAADDFVDDTPLANTDNGDYTSPCTFPNPDDNEVCVVGEPEMFQNYMDYTDDICMNLFTNGQKTRMRTVMENAVNRLSLTTSPGLTEPAKFADDLAAVDIISPEYAQCESSVIPIVRVENHGTTVVTSYDVQLYLDGSPNGSAQNVTTSLAPLSSDTVAFSAKAISSTPSSVSFEIINVNGGTDGNTSNNLITRNISATNSMNLPFIESFEGTPDVLGTYGVLFPWEVANAPKTTPSNQAFIFKAHDNTEWFGETAIFKTPIFDLTGLPSGDLLFSYAHANPLNTFYDGLMVKASIDCGETFPDLIFSSFGPNLATAPEADTYFVPANQLEWIDTLLSITEYRDIDGVQFAFIGINGSGNNIYVDDIQVVETNLFENDIIPTNLNAPLITCAETSELDLRIRNVGSQIITSFEVKYHVNGDTTLTSFSGLSISSKDYATVSINANNLNEGENNVGAEITLVNGVSDESVIDNSIQIMLNRNVIEDNYPLNVDFESTDNWSLTSTGSNILFERAQSFSNGVLRANGFGATELGKSSWFISPKLNTGGLDSAGLYFKASYASSPGFNDRLQVLLSTDCGESYPTILLDADSDSLAVISTSEQWTPLTDDDWNEYRLDLSHSFFFDENIRIAFVFTPGGGNDLYIDDISIRGNEVPTYENLTRVFPNPAITRFNVGLNLPQKESVTIRIIDISGRIVFEEQIENALNQILEYQAPSQEGLYFINVEGSQFSTSQKLFISR
ncbi:choice-of-anchor J domain-containing protein [Ekhidna sp.]|uniref:T9SS-dependent choice-of-anchor J family protein n=1 Tax=Ekhidna sp. TaxID=2608089 RepID=UPI003299F021